MTSKDKLIEFLKSANITYEEYSMEDGSCIEVNYVTFVFDELGEYFING